jgi:hypothetical protein
VRPLPMNIFLSFFCFLSNASNLHFRTRDSYVLFIYFTFYVFFFLIPCYDLRQFVVIGSRYKTLYTLISFFSSVPLHKRLLSKPIDLVFEVIELRIKRSA